VTLDPDGGSAPDPHYMLALRARHGVTTALNTSHFDPHFSERFTAPEKNYMWTWAA